MYIRLHKMLKVLSYFSLKEWKFKNERWTEALSKLQKEDQELFYCDIKDVFWDNYFRTFLLGVRLYLLKDPMETVPKARKKWRRLYWIHQTVKYLFASIFITIVCILIYKLIITFAYV
ncbi:PREDICTED: putative fatty acyl-CoA reductase CG5065 [Polistes dominula]|uniref:Fatty acyl-CoA reductase CG5065 n=1 Tax=Polistes dominula TaxID=743375 RepID=A0ABM1JBZ8_POLDO|nr:PREDICTED: putative fatty acyl-CoA reductase CG5065 [Polistes dominula]